MNRSKILVVLLLISSLIGWGGCTNSTDKDPVEALAAEVMAIHDEIMPKMGNMVKLEKDLRKEVEALQQAETPDNKKIEALKQEILKLKSTNEGMMQWMRDYSPPNKDDQAAALTYLGAELEKIREVAKKMNASIEQANQLLQK